MTIALDTETTGRDFGHGTLPFFVTVADTDGSVKFWEWPVDPFTRIPAIPKQDVKDIRNMLEVIGGWGRDFDAETAARHCVVGHNIKFDAHALAAIGIDNWPWEQTHDTLCAGHVLASNRPHSLDAMAVQYLGLDMTPYEKALEEAVKKARQLCRTRGFQSEHGVWAIAKEGREDMPSAKTGGNKEDDKLWKADTWLPKALWDRVPSVKEEYPAWEHALRDYANTDSPVTLALWQEVKGLLRDHGLWNIYEVKRSLLGPLFRMEQTGVTLNKPRMGELVVRYEGESAEHKAVCVNIAKSYGYELEMPAGGGVNKSLREFCFDVMKLERLRDPKAKTDAPTLNGKIAIPHYMATLPERSKERTFIESLVAKRQADTALSYMAAYERFWITFPDGDEYRDWRVIHQDTNPTGTDTTRLSVSRPNTQNISKKEDYNTRYCFGPGPCREWWSMDAENIELRIPAYESGEADLIALFEKRDEPPYYGSEHLLNFHTVYPDVWDGEIGKVCNLKCCGGKVVTRDTVGPHVKKKFESTWYKWCKNGDFAVGYQAGDETADRAFHRAGSRTRLKARFAKKEALNQKWMRFADKHGYVETTPDKTIDPKRGYPLLVTRSDWGKVKPTEPLNYHVQGTAGWWMYKAIIRVDKFYRDLNGGMRFAGRGWPGGYYLVLTVHDELVSDMPKGKTPEYNHPVVREVKRLMELGGEDIGLPTPVGVEWNPNHWAEGIKVKL